MTRKISSIGRAFRLHRRGWRFESVIFHSKESSSIGRVLVSKTNGWGFEPLLSWHGFIRPIRLVVRTLPFHGNNTGSNPVWVNSIKIKFYFFNKVAAKLLKPGKSIEMQRNQVARLFWEQEAMSSNLIISIGEIVQLVRTLES